MKFIKALCLALTILFLTSCDPIYPTGDLKIKGDTKISVGESTSIEIIYPNNGGSIVEDWTNTTVEIISGKDIIEVSKVTDSNTFTVKGLKEGTATIKISTTTVLSQDAKSSQEYEEKTYNKEIEIKVK